MIGIHTKLLFTDYVYCLTIVQMEEFLLIIYLKHNLLIVAWGSSKLEFMYFEKNISGSSNINIWIRNVRQQTGGANLVYKSFSNYTFFRPKSKQNT